MIKSILSKKELIRLMDDGSWLQLTVFIVMVIFGALASLDLVWNLGDLFMGSITLFNLFAIVKLHPHAVFLLKDYMRQKRAGIKSPTFHKRQMPEIADELSAWDE